MMLTAAMFLVRGCNSKAPDVTQGNPAPAPSLGPGNGHETLWWRGGGSSFVDTDVELLTFSARSKGVYIETNFEFDASKVAAGADGRALEPGTCVRADRPYGSGRIRLEYGEEEEGHICWRTSEKGSTTPGGDGSSRRRRFGQWLMKAEVTKASEIGSHRIYRL